VEIGRSSKQNNFRIGTSVKIGDEDSQIQSQMPIVNNVSRNVTAIE